MNKETIYINIDDVAAVDMTAELLGVQTIANEMTISVEVTFDFDPEDLLIEIGDLRVTGVWFLLEPTYETPLALQPELNEILSHWLGDLDLIEVKLWELRDGEN